MDPFCGPQKDPKSEDTAIALFCASKGRPQKQTHIVVPFVVPFGRPESGADAVNLKSKLQRGSVHILHSFHSTRDPTVGERWAQSWGFSQKQLQYRDDLSDDLLAQKAGQG